jgi:hypothetical protein
MSRSVANSVLSSSRAAALSAAGSMPSAAQRAQHNLVQQLDLALGDSVTRSDAAERLFGEVRELEQRTRIDRASGEPQLANQLAPLLAHRQRRRGAQLLGDDARHIGMHAAGIDAAVAQQREQVATRVADRQRHPRTCQSPAAQRRTPPRGRRGARRSSARTPARTRRCTGARRRRAPCPAR